MKSSFQSHKRTFLSVAVSLSFLISVSFDQNVIAQHEGHVMPGTSKSKPKTAAKRKPKRKIRRRATAQRPKVNTSNGTPMPAGHKHTPGVVLPAPTASPAAPVTTGHEHTPGMVMPAPTASPAAPATTGHEHTPGMVMPAPTAAPASGGVPQVPQHDPHTATPDPSPNPAQSAHDAMDHSKMTVPQPDKEPATPAASVEHGEHTGAHAMGPLMVMSGDNMSIRVGSSETNLLPMGQLGSGTSWTPATTPMHMIHKQAGNWLLMLHYNAVVGGNSQGGPRGVTKFESANWIMPMAFRKLGKGTLQLRGMFSFEPFTFPPGGSPLLFQTGETYKGRPIIDAQHPHDLFMELSAQYTHPLGERGTWFAYVGYPGEPALGPTAFMHRASASENPAAALSHHLQDSSHISFGVLTTGFTYRWFKLEGSVFNGREPDENRYNFEAHPWTSRSARLSFAPNSNWAIQVSHGLLKNPEALEPGDVRRTTASISYNLPFERGNWASSLIWGRNHETHSGETFNLNGYVAESTVNFLDKNYLYTRLELVDKNALLRDADRLLLGITDHHPSFRIGAYTFGGARDIWGSEKISVALGSDVTFYSKPAQLDPIYGNNPVSYRFFLRFRSGKMSMAGPGDSHPGMNH